MTNSQHSGPHDNDMDEAQIQAAIERILASDQSAADKSTHFGAPEHEGIFSGPSPGAEQPDPVNTRPSTARQEDLAERRACAAWRGCPPSSRTSPRSSTASCGWRRSSWSASGARARRPTPRSPCASWPARRDRRLAGPRRAAPAPRQARPGHVPRLGQGRRAARRSSRPRRRHRGRRRRARTVAAPRAGGHRPRQGRRPDRADPRHLRPARQVPGGQGAGRARAAGVPAAAPARLGRLDVPAGRWPGRRRGGGMGSRGPGETKIELDRRRIRNRMAKLRREIAAMEPGRVTKRAVAQEATRSRPSRSPATPTRASRRCSTG